MNDFIQRTNDLYEKILSNSTLADKEKEEYTLEVNSLIEKIKNSSDSYTKDDIKRLVKAFNRKEDYLSLLRKIWEEQDDGKFQDKYDLASNSREWMDGNFNNIFNELLAKPSILQSKKDKLYKLIADFGYTDDELKKLKHLLKNYFYINSENADNIIKAAGVKNVNFLKNSDNIKKILELDGNFSGYDMRGSTILHYSNIKNKHFFSNFICDKNPDLINKKDISGNTILHYDVMLRSEARFPQRLINTKLKLTCRITAVKPRYIYC